MKNFLKIFKKVLIFSSIILILIVCCDIPMTNSSMAGTFVNTNYDKSPCCVEAPHTADTLIIRSDGTFYSQFYGEGTFKVGFDIYNPKMILDYDKNGKGSIYTYCQNTLFEKTKIILNDQRSHYYEKID